MTDGSPSRLIGRTISHYRIVGLLGAGGMGVVYRAEDVRLGRPVAVKFIADDFAHDAVAVSRLRAEARTASALNHPNICTIYDIGSDDGQPFIVMELMQGQTLRERLARGSLKVHEIVELGIQIADALQAAHAGGIIHRDIKPANIFLTERAQVKILDFGLAKLTAERLGFDSSTIDTPGHTRAGTTLGTIAYMSPEQATGEDLDGRTDLFSLGVVLYECATGRQPFQGKTPAVILSGILNRAPVMPGVLNPELSVRLQEVITNCLEKDRELRYQSAADLRADLKRVRRDIESGHAPPAGLDQTDGVASPAVTAGTGDHSAPRASGTDNATVRAAPVRGVWRLAVGGLVLIAVLGAGSWALWDRSPSLSRDAPSASAEQSGIIQNRLSLAQSSLDARNPRAAQAYAAEVLAIDPAHPVALGIGKQAQAALSQFDEAVIAARQRLDADDLQGAAQALSRAREIDSAAPDVGGIAAALAERVRGVESMVRPSTRRVTPQPEEPVASRPATRTPLPGRSGGETAPAAAAGIPAPSPPPAAPPPPPPAAAPPATVSVESAPPPPPLAPAAAAARPPDAAPTPPADTPPVQDKPPLPAGPGPAGEDDAAIRRVIADYARAIEGKDVRLFRTLKPNLSREEERRLQEGFRAVSQQHVNLTILSIAVRGREASVLVQRRDTLEAGGRQQTVESRQTFGLTRAGTAWVIDEIR